MKSASESTQPKRNKGFDETHHEIIEAAVRLISEKGVGALSMAAVARAVGINRTTLYYHFDDREALLRAVKLWSSEQLMKVFSLDLPQQDRIDYLSRFVLENPELIKLWIEDFISGGDIRNSYPLWDALVDGVRSTFAAEFPDETIDAEVYCLGLVTSAVIAPASSGTASALTKISKRSSAGSGPSSSACSSMMRCSGDRDPAGFELPGEHEPDAQPGACFAGGRGSGRR